MGRALSMDLRERVVAAIGSWMSRRAAALRFGIGAATAVRWAGLMRDRGSAAPRRQGGAASAGRRHALWPYRRPCGTDFTRRSALGATPDATLAELRATLAGEGVSLAVSTLWRFFARHAIARKKRPATPPSRTAPTC